MIFLQYALHDNKPILNWFAPLITITGLMQLNRLHLYLFIRVRVHILTITHRFIRPTVSAHSNAIILHRLFVLLINHGTIPLMRVCAHQDQSQVPMASAKPVNP